MVFVTAKVYVNVLLVIGVLVVRKALVVVVCASTHQRRLLLSLQRCCKHYLRTLTSLHGRMVWLPLCLLPHVVLKVHVRRIIAHVKMASLAPFAHWNLALTTAPSLASAHILHPPSSPLAHAYMAPVDPTALSTAVKAAVVMVPVWLLSLLAR